MVDKPQAAESKPTAETAAAPPTQPPRRTPGHRATDARDTVAEMALRAQEISQEAGSKIAQAMKDVINAAAGIATFAVESARDVVQYMVRRGQMTQEEADRIIREAEEAHARRKPAGKPAAAPVAAAPSAVSAPSRPATSRGHGSEKEAAPTASKKGAPAKAAKSPSREAKAREKAPAKKKASAAKPKAAAKAPAAKKKK